MSRRWILALVLGLLPLLWLSIPPSGELSKGDYWMFAGTYSSRSGRGIYLDRFRAATGAVQLQGLAAGPLWQSNRGAWRGSLPRIVSQIKNGFPSARAIWKGVQNPVFLAVHPNRRFLYSADDNANGTVSAFRIDGVNGKLTVLNTKPSGGPRPCYLTVDLTGRNLLAANYGGTVAVLPIDSSGRLGDASSVVRQSGEGREAHAHSIVVSPDNRFAIAADLGLDQIRVYRFDASKGVLTPHSPPLLQLPRGSLPRYFTFHPNGIFAYIVTESSTVVTLRWDAYAGVLTPLETVSTLPADFHGESAAADIAVHPNGNFLYASNRGHDSIVVFAIDSATGSLKPIQYISSQGQRPNNFRIAPGGDFLFVANMQTNSIVQFGIDRQTGRLSPAGARFQAGAPACIRFVPAEF